MLDNFFKDLLIIELASVLAGPSVGAFFTELGAKVIKIENKKTGGDVTRNWKGPSEESDQAFSAYWASVNLGKEVELLDLSEEKDQQYVHELIKKADIVLTNFKETSAKRMRMDYKFLSALNPKLIFAELTAFGSEEENRPAFDVVLQAEAGFLYMNGEPDREPVKMPVALIDILAGHQLKEAILLGLLNRTKTNKGIYLTVSLLDAAIASLANQANNWLMAGQIPQRMGTLHPNIAPYGEMFYCADGKAIVLAIGTEGHFKQLCSVLNLNDLPNDDRFAVNAARVRHRAELKGILSVPIGAYNRPNLLKLLHEQRVPVGSIKDMKEVFNSKAAEKMVLKGTMPDGRAGKRVRTVVFQTKN
ncbi:MAG: crotonobetainyl-CoA:carnitine CoA-transferase CaiB-like acyl-CoA transferase [Polaribacter sp.]|jgi:crotonobetainyl-CoA:carnitine CoA-transferase CaiB-like acyl-CoA transferase